MTLSGRAGSIRRNNRSASQMIVAGLVVLAVVASLFLVFSDSVQALRIGLVAALWAAVVGAIAMTKYRRESAADKAKIRDLQTVYELQLEREVTARREYEAGVEARVRGELGADGSELAALRAELAALRGSLEVLFEGRLPVDRTAIAGDGRRVELGAGSSRPAPGARPFAPNPAYADPSAGPRFASPDDEPVTAEVSLVEPGVEPERRPVRAWSPVEPAPVDIEAPAEAELPAEARAEAEPPVEAQVEAEPPVETEPEPEPEAEPAVEADDGPAPRRSRRRAESDADGDGAHSNGLTVAEILANMRAEGADSGTVRQGRRRRE